MTDRIHKVMGTICDRKAIPRMEETVSFLSLKRGRTLTVLIIEAYLYFPLIAKNYKSLLVKPYVSGLTGNSN